MAKKIGVDGPELAGASKGSPAPIFWPYFRPFVVRSSERHNVTKNRIEDKNPS